MRYFFATEIKNVKQFYCFQMKILKQLFLFLKFVKEKNKQVIIKKFSVIACNFLKNIHDKINIYMAKYSVNE